MKTGIQQSAIETIEKEANAIAGLKAFINDAFEKAVIIIHNCRGRVVLTGIGKSAIVAKKIVATLNSTGTASLLCMPQMLCMVIWE